MFDNMSFTEILKVFWPLFAFNLAMIIWALSDLFRRKRVKFLPKIVWGLIIVGFELLGPIIYLAVGRDE